MNLTTKDCLSALAHGLFKPMTQADYDNAPGAELGSFKWESDQAEVFYEPTNMIFSLLWMDSEDECHQIELYLNARKVKVL